MAPESGIDDRVRHALAPDSDTIDRMVATALRRGRRSRRRPIGGMRLALAGAAVLACALYLARPYAPPTASPDDVVFTRAGDVFLVQSASGEIFILGPTPAPDPAKAGTGYVIVEGDPQ